MVFSFTRGIYHDWPLASELFIPFTGSERYCVFDQGGGHSNHAREQDAIKAADSFLSNHATR
jgi:hypothetical protein